MKIVQVISHYLPAIRFGGPLHVAHGLGRALVEAGHEVTVCTTNMLDADMNMDVSVGEPVDIDGVRVIYEPVKRLRYWGFSPKLLKRVYQEISEADIVLTHFHYQFASVIGGWCARLHRKPHVVFTHGGLNRYGIQARHRLFKSAYLRVLERNNFKRSLFTAYHSSMEKQESYALGPHTDVVPIGVDPTLVNYTPKKGLFKARYPQLQHRFVLGYLGRLAPGKGLDLLLPALRALLDQGLEVSLVMIGGDERGYQDFLLERVKVLNLEAHVIFTGLLSGEDKFEALVDADLFVLPSRSEGMSIAALEAMALGVPVLISERVGLDKDVLEHQCGVVIPYDEKALIHALGEIIKRDDLIEMGQKAAELIQKKYNWSLITQNLLEKITERQCSPREMA